jgi:16S rRNA (cytidine1402-2'-O)-methyltransferase
MTYRAVQTLQDVAVIGAEDTRTSGILLKHYNIKTPMISYHKFNEKSRVGAIVDYLLSGKDVAIISDAGMPGISDPAEIIIKEVIKLDITVCALPGATAFLPALVSSGLNAGSFLFIGFLPSKKGERERLLQSLSAETSTIIFYASTHELFTFLEAVRKTLGNRRLVIGRELTKLYETYYRNTIDFFLENRDQITQKGEFTVICEGATLETTTDEKVIKQLQRYFNKGETESFAVKSVSKQLGVPKNRVYKIALALDKINTKDTKA